eukprot:scaffold1143_cov177-Amphora_coffeaeformis.AAC.18
MQAARMEASPAKALSRPQIHGNVDAQVGKMRCLVMKHFPVDGNECVVLSKVEELGMVLVADVTNGGDVNFFFISFLTRHGYLFAAGGTNVKIQTIELS